MLAVYLAYFILGWGVADFTQEILGKSFTTMCLGLVLLFFILFNINIVNADTLHPKYKIAIIDTGLNPRITTGLKLCKTGHYDFRTHQPVVRYSQAHGTRIATIIGERLEFTDYCAIVYQVEDRTGYIPIKNIVAALDMARNQHVDAVNYSLSDDGFKTSIAERESLKRLSNDNIMVFVPAGNSGHNLDDECDEFPVCYKIKNVIPVGALDPNTGVRSVTSNYGSDIHFWFSGDGPLNSIPDYGTSYAAPRALAEYILRLSKVEKVGSL